MHQYRKMKATEESVRAKIQQGLELARKFLDEARKTTDDISDIRCCSFGFELIHIEVRWDWQDDKLFLLLGTLERHHGKITTEGLADAARMVMEIATDFNRTYIYYCALGG